MRLSQEVLLPHHTPFGSPLPSSQGSWAAGLARGRALLAQAAAEGWTAQAAAASSPVCVVGSKVVGASFVKADVSGSRV